MHTYLCYFRLSLSRRQNHCRRSRCVTLCKSGWWPATAHASNLRAWPITNLNCKPGAHSPWLLRSAAISTATNSTPSWLIGPYNLSRSVIPAASEYRASWSRNLYSFDVGLINRLQKSGQFLYAIAVLVALETSWRGMVQWQRNTRNFYSPETGS